MLEIWKEWVILQLEATYYVDKLYLECDSDMDTISAAAKILSLP